MDAVDRTVAEMEPAVARLSGRGIDLDEAAVISIAISLKRIADCMDGTVLGVDGGQSLAALSTVMIRRP